MPQHSGLQEEDILEVLVSYSLYPSFKRAYEKLIISTWQDHANGPLTIRMLRRPLVSRIPDTLREMVEG